jgi:hypothetical protein
MPSGPLEISGKDWRQKIGLVNSLDNTADSRHLLVVTCSQDGATTHEMHYLFSALKMKIIHQAC